MKASTAQSPPANLKPSTGYEWGEKNSPSLRSKAFLPEYEYSRSSVSHSVVSDSLRPHGLQSARLLCPWNSSGKNTGVGCPFLLQGIFPTQGSNLDLLRCRQILYHLSYTDGQQLSISKSPLPPRKNSGKLPPLLTTWQVCFPSSSRRASAYLNKASPLFSSKICLFLASLLKS